MNWKGIARGIWRGAKAAAPVAAVVAQAAGVPIIGVVLNAALVSEAQGGTGSEKFGTAMRYLDISAPLVIDQLERQFGVEIPDEAAAAYMRAQLQAHVDLMNAVGLLPKGSK